MVAVMTSGQHKRGRDENRSVNRNVQRPNDFYIICNIRLHKVKNNSNNLKNYIDISF